MDHLNNRLDKYKLEHDWGPGIVHQLRMILDMDLYIFDWCKHLDFHILY